MVTRTKRVTLTFQHPFALKSVDRLLTAGDYEVVTDEELIEDLSFPVYRRVATMIMLPTDVRRSSIEMVTVDPADLATAHKLDSAVTESNLTMNPHVAKGGSIAPVTAVVKNRARMPSPAMESAWTQSRRLRMVISSREARRTWKARRPSKRC